MSEGVCWHTAVRQLPLGWPQHAASQCVVTVCISSAEPAACWASLICLFDHLKLSERAIQTNTPNQTTHRGLSLSDITKPDFFYWFASKRKRSLLVYPYLTFLADSHPQCNMFVWLQITVILNIWLSLLVKTCYVCVQS